MNCLPISMILYLSLYRPQRSWAKVMFSQACVCPQGEGCLPQCMLGYPPPWSRHPPRADTPLEQTPPGADTPQKRHPPRSGTHPGPGTPPPPWEQTPPGADPLDQEPPQSRPPTRHTPRIRHPPTLGTPTPGTPGQEQTPSWTRHPPRPGTPLDQAHPCGKQTAAYG